jgi:hypothetical protein
MKAKIDLYILKIQSRSTTCFPILDKHLRISSCDLPDSIKQEIVDHLSKIRSDFDKYFSQNELQHIWIQNPFIFNAQNMPRDLPDPAQDELIDLTFDEKAKIEFTSFSLYQFWSKMKGKYIELSKTAQKILTEFPTSYLAEQCFSVMNFQKNKKRNRLELEPDLRIKISKRVPDFDAIISKNIDTDFTS